VSLVKFRPTPQLTPPPGPLYETGLYGTTTTISQQPSLPPITVNISNSAGLSALTKPTAITLLQNHIASVHCLSVTTVICDAGVWKKSFSKSSPSLLERCLYTSLTHSTCLHLPRYPQTFLHTPPSILEQMSVTILVRRILEIQIAVSLMNVLWSFSMNILQRSRFWNLLAGFAFVYRAKV
jgi:hypothetical protein